MGKVKDITGQKFGRLTVIKFLRIENHKAIWLCKCECGNLKEIATGALTSGNTKSCGCLNHEPTIIKHGKYDTRLYRILHDMKRRCYNKDSKAYNNYGNRGVAVCDEWLQDFQAFYDWSMANGYDDTLTIDRIDVNGNYEPSNCRWATRKQQNRNTRRNRNYTINGETHCLKEWCEILNLNYNTVRKRLNRLNWSIERALNIVSTQ